MTTIATQIREYASRSLNENYGDDETPAAILTAIVEAQNSSEIEHLGRALLARHESLCDESHAYGKENYDPALKVIAERLGWAP